MSIQNKSEVTHHGTISPEYALLGLLLERPSHGYDLHQKLNKEMGFVWHVSQSQAYAILKRLEFHGHITSKTLEQEKLPPRQIMHVTSRGKKHFMDWLKKPTFRSVRAIRLELITRLFFLSKLSPGFIPDFLCREMTRLRIVITELESRLDDIPEDQIFNRISLSLRIRQMESALDWLGECRGELGIFNNAETIDE